MLEYITLVFSPHSFMHTPWQRMILWQSTVMPLTIEPKNNSTLRDICSDSVTREVRGSHIQMALRLGSRHSRDTKGVQKHVIMSGIYTDAKQIAARRPSSTSAHKTHLLATAPARARCPWSSRPPSRYCGHPLASDSVYWKSEQYSSHVQGWW